MIRYRFSEFTLSPQRRLLVREGHEVPLIPRYFDLLLLLVERRREAVHRREIFERVWGDVNVSDSALSQAVRTIRSTLGDDSREPRFIRTVSRHGYQFVFPDVIEEPDEGDAAATPLRVAVESPPHSTRTGWTEASAGGALAGIAAGALGGLILALAPDSTAPIALAPVLAVIGGACGALGGAGIGAGLTFTEARAHSPRAVALPVAAAIGGGVVGFAVQWLSRWALAALVGLDINIGGGLEGVVIGGAAGFGFALVTRRVAGEPPVTRGKPLHAALVIALICGIAGLALTLTGRPLAGGTIHAIADAADGSRAALTPLGRLIGEPDFGPVTGAILAFGEAATFGFGLALGATRRQR